MTVLPLSPPLHVHNQQTFETCIALTLQLVATLEFAPVLGRDRPTREMILAFAEQAERHAQGVAALAGAPETDLQAAGQHWYANLTAQRDDPLQVAYHALHAAAYLGLDGGATTGTLLAAVAHALRVLAGREGTLTN
ncbi:hypothetical protein [Deinococcus planocerae]|uniref:hypothetical protein n=1 Tax=Deinococcus planocerae TaxID=1737569 RepID=UPI000C7E9F5B|nr:hypothetical protein [Deinococcus planocerae]